MSAPAANPAANSAYATTTDGPGLASAVAGRPLPAWLMSVALHATVVVLLALLWKATPMRGSGGDPARRAGIVVAAEVEGETQYFEPASDSAPQEAAQSAVSAAADPLPPMSDTADLPDIALPGAVERHASGDALVGPDLGLRPGTGRPSDLEGAAEAIRALEAAARPPVPTGPKAQMTLFGAPAVGRSFVFVIDRSKSMGSTGLGALMAAQRELGAALEPLTPAQKFDVIAYHHESLSLAEQYEGRQRLLPADEQNRARVKQFFNGLAAFGATQHAFGLHAALDLKPEVIYLLTDGGDPYLTPAQQLEITRRAQRTGVAIHCVQFGFGPLQEENNFMQRLARDNNGSFRYINMSARR